MTLMAWCRLTWSGLCGVEEEEGRGRGEIGKSRSESLLIMRKEPTRSRQQRRLPPSCDTLSRVHIQYPAEFM